MGRRGQLVVMHDVIMGILLAVMIGAAMWAYISANANGDLYFSRFYTADLSTSAEVVSASYGDTELRYDNLRPGMDFTLTNGRISAAGTSSDAPLASATWGKTERFEGDKLTTPTFIILRKVGEGLTIAELDVDDACPMPKVNTPADEAVIFVQGSEAVRTAFKQTLKGTPITVTNDTAAANIKITVQSRAGENAIAFSATNSEGQGLACHFARQIAAVSVTPFTANKPQATQSSFALTIDITKRADAVLTDEQAGKALARAFVMYYREAGK